MEPIKINVADSRMYGILALYDMHTSFLKNAIDGLDDDDAHNRLGTKANHVAWLAGSLVESRFEGVRNLGMDMKQEAHELFKDHQGIQDDVKYPSLAQYLVDWERVGPVLRELSVKLSAAELDKPFNMPGMEMTYYELIAFMTYREASIIGQVALWRRLLGYAPMNYM
jgi:hypothetical protein